MVTIDYVEFDVIEIIIGMIIGGVIGFIALWFVSLILDKKGYYD